MEFTQYSKYLIKLIPSFVGRFKIMFIGVFILFDMVIFYYLNPEFFPIQEIIADIFPEEETRVTYVAIAASTWLFFFFLQLYRHAVRIPKYHNPYEDNDPYDYERD